MSKKEELVTFEIADEFLRYEPETGKLFWKERDIKWFSESLSFSKKNQISNVWNKKFANKEAITATSKSGYKLGTVLGKYFYAHRLAWLLYYGEWPNHEIDHINGIRDDNRIENLRDVTSQVNNKNLFLKSSNTSGVTGVNWDKKNKKWSASIKSSGIYYFLGRFSNKEDAIKIRKQAEIEYKFSERHGKERPNE